MPVPGLGIATDMVAMTTMTMSLCAVFGGNIKEEAAKTLAIAAIKNTMLKQPMKVLAKELSKLVPGLGQIVAPSITIVMLEAAGWVLATELEQAHSDKVAKRTSVKSGSIADIIQKNFTPAPERAAPKKAVPKKTASSKSTAKKAAKKTTSKAAKRSRVRA